jgi:uncharacterized protein YqjF (DUF2071 family)
MYVMVQRWNDLLFMHWPVPAAHMRALVPDSLELDLFDGSAWVSVTPFYLSHLRPRGLPPVPGVSAFPEVNVRTYVTRDGRPGVYFFSLDAGNRLAVAGARATYHLPYFRALMTVTRVPAGPVQYHSHRTHHGARPAELSVEYKPIGDVYRSASGTLDHFLTERYCLYALDDQQRVYRADIAHERWPLQPAEVRIVTNTMASAAGMDVVGPPRAAFARRMDVEVWWPARV